MLFLFFCTLDCLPPDLRSHHWGREAISKEFSALACHGFVSSCSEEMRGVVFWDSLITAFMMRQKEIDQDFLSRLVELAKDT
jgi:hypothetical protein